MGWWTSSSAAGARILSGMLAVSALAGCQFSVLDATANLFAPPGATLSAEACRRSPVERGRENPLEVYVNTEPGRVFNACNSIVLNPRARADQLVNAQYYTARALAALQDVEGQAADRESLERALHLLELVSLAPWPEAEPVRHRARVQIARVHRLMIGRPGNALVDRRLFGEALSHLDRALSGSQGEASDSVALDARYERALILLRRQETGDSESALRDLTVFATTGGTRSAWSMVNDRGRKELIKVAMQLGADALDETPTSANVDRALDYFGRARTALGRSAPDGVDVANIYIQLGNASLRRAALARDVSIDRQCTVSQDADASRLLNQALEHFQVATNHPDHAPRAQLGGGCALLAQGRFDDAARAFAAAEQAGRFSVDDYVELAGNYAEMAAIADAQANPIGQDYWRGSERLYGAALAAVGPDGLGADGRRRARVYVKIAESRQARGDLVAAVNALNDALIAQANLPEALLARGRLVCAPLPAPTPDANGLIPLYVPDRPCRDFTAAVTPLEARQNLQAVVDQIPAPNSELRGEANYYLSLLADRPTREGGNGVAAVRHADAAFSLALTPEYRKHACLMRIRYYHLRDVGVRNERSRDEGTRYCLAGETRTPSALLIEGEYHMSRARVLPGGARERAREEAYRTFGEALRLLGRDDTEQARNLRNRLELGQAFIQYCMGLEGVGGEAITRIDRDGRIRAYYDAHNVWDCAAPRS